MKRPSSKDVAKLANVSRTTVSYVLNDRKDVKIKEETKKKVLDACRQLNYYVDANAKNLKNSTSMTIGFVTNRAIIDSRYSEVIYGAKKILDDSSYSLLLLNLDDDDFFDAYMQRRVDGLIFLSYIEDIKKKRIEAIQKKVSKYKIPVVFLDYHLNLSNAIDIDYNHGAKIVAEEIKKRGYKRVLYVEANTRTVQEKERRRGLVEKKLDFDAVFYSTGNEIAKMIIENEEKYDCVIFAWSNYYRNVLLWLMKYGFDLNKKIRLASLAHINDVIEEINKPTHIHLPLQELGNEAAKSLLDQINGNKKDIKKSISCRLV